MSVALTMPPSHVYPPNVVAMYISNVVVECFIQMYISNVHVSYRREAMATKMQNELGGFTTSRESPPSHFASWSLSPPLGASRGTLGHRHGAALVIRDFPSLSPPLFTLAPCITWMVHGIRVRKVKETDGQFFISKCVPLSFPTPCFQKHASYSIALKCFI